MSYVQYQTQGINFLVSILAILPQSESYGWPRFMGHLTSAATTRKCNIRNQRQDAINNTLLVWCSVKLNFFVVLFWHTASHSRWGCRNWSRRLKPLQNNPFPFVSKDQIVLDHQVKKNEVLQFAQWSISMVKNSGNLGPDCLESTILKITGKICLVI